MSPITVIPAIDLKGGKCVRLRQGKAEDSTVYSEDPVAMALHWLREGAEYLHVVDLDGAFQGHPVHQDVIRQIAAALTIPVEVGGGLRRDEDVELMLRCGVRRAILGTRAWSEPDTLKNLVQRFGSAIAVGIDARDGWVQVKGWTQTTREKALDLARRMEQAGVSTIIYTDTATDGMLQGPNVAAVEAVCGAVACSVIASGGIASRADLDALGALRRPNLTGAIVGKALYEGTVTLKNLLETRPSAGG